MLTTKVCTMDKIKLNKKATQNPSNSKPSTIPDTIQTIRVLIRKLNNPKVKNVIGMETNCSTGFITKLNILNTKTTIIDVPKLSTDAPGKKFANTYTITADNIQLIIVFIMFLFLLNNFSNIMLFIYKTNIFFLYHLLKTFWL